jgi:hypothetical protein
VEEVMEVDTYRIPRMGERKIYRRIPVEGDYQSLTMADGERYYIRMRPAEDEEQPSLKAKKVDSLGLCGQPYNVMLEQAIQEQLRTKDSRSTTLESVDSGIDSSSEDEATLWVEKFRPRSYMQLLSDDGTNRYVSYIKKFVKPCDSKYFIAILKENI